MMRFTTSVISIQRNCNTPKTKPPTTLKSRTAMCKVAIIACAQCPFWKTNDPQNNDTGICDNPQMQQFDLLWGCPLTQVN